MVYVLLALKLFAVEMGIKSYVEQKFTDDQKTDILNGRVTLKKLHNKGAILGFLKNRTGVLKVASGLVLLFFLFCYQTILAKKQKPLVKTGCAVLLAGAAGNLYDRLKRGYVVDYFSVKVKPIRDVVFNLSDLFILIGSMLILTFGRKSNSR